MSKSVVSLRLRSRLAGLSLNALAALSLTAVPALAQSPNAAAPDPARMDQVVRASADQNVFMGSVLVARNGKILLDQGHGFANLEWRVPNTGDTKFRLGSLSKQFTAVAIMRLYEQGKVDLDAPVKTYLPDAPAAWDKVTTRNLLSHTAGIPNFTNLPDYASLQTRPATLTSLIDRFRDRPLDFQPGEGYAYSNSGYVLLTAIIEATSGQAYAPFVTQTLFAPLGMTDSGYDSHEAILANRASGYSPTEDGIVNADYIDMTVPQGAGALYSTTHDLLKWEQGLFGGRLLKPESLTILTTPVRDNYAMGLIVSQTDGRTLIRHNGSIDGFNTYMAYDPADRTTVVVLGNLNGDAPDKLGAALVTLARGGTVTLANERQALALAPDKLQAYAGVYELAPTFAITVSVSGGKLMAQATGQQAFEMTAEARDAFFLSTVDAQITFDRDAAGAVTGLVLHQGGRDMPGRRK